MNNIEKSHRNNSPPSLDHLPDEIILLIFNKLNDLKTLCFCHLTSKRFSSITLQVTTISFTPPNLNPNHTFDNTTSTSADVTPPKRIFRSFVNGIVFKPLHLIRRIIVPSSRPLPPIISSFYGESFRSAVSFLCKLDLLKSLCVQLPCSIHIDNRYSFRWKVKFGNRIESFMFISSNSIRDGGGLIYGNIEEDVIESSSELFRKKVHIAFQCLKDVIIRHRMLLYFVKGMPLLETVSVTDSERRGRVRLSGGRRVGEIRDWIRFAAADMKLEMSRIEVPVSVSHCYVPELNLPNSGCEMKGVTFVVMQMNTFEGGNGNGNESFMNDDDDYDDYDDGIEGKEEAAYNEAVMEILENHKDKMKSLL
ncbi:F-box protein AUF2-like [Rutidosis leptorrhynchoides]|uniref:F-box protein AUF2-like n=1 Tax=Rutidosis leptorrhynchoides TaxID=125765 RepID=UPI003A99A460